MAFAVEGFSTIAQNYISKGIASNFYPKLPFLSMLGALTLGNNNKDTLDIGRPGVGEILSGRQISVAEKLNLGRINSYLPRVQLFETSNSAWLSSYGSMPTVNVPGTATATSGAQSLMVQASAKFNWCEYITPIMIMHEDKIRAGQAGTREGQAIAMSQLVDESTEIAFQEHIKGINTGIWSGSAASQTADLWSAPLGISVAVAATNTYGNIDRGTHTQWAAQVDSTTTSVDIANIIDNANITKSLRTKGPGVDLIICNPDLYPSFKRQVLANGGCVVQNGPIVKMAKWGVTQEVLQKDNAYIMYDPTCPANTVYALTSSTWRIAFHPERNFTVGKFVDLTQTGEGGRDADQAHIRTRFIFSCDNPFLNVKYSAIGT